MSKKVIIIGGLGNGSVIAHAIHDANLRGHKEWICAGFLNDKITKGEKIENIAVLGSLKDIQNFIDQGYYFIYAIYRINNKQERIDKFYELNIPEKQLATFIHPMAYVAPQVQIGVGSVVMPNVSISPSSIIGKCCGIMIGSAIGHNNIIGDFCHFAAQSSVGAFINIGNAVNIGINASVRENITIADKATIGMGAVLTKNVGEGEMWFGNPAKFYKKNN